jgi:hypothetical protein
VTSTEAQFQYGRACVIGGRTPTGKPAPLLEEGVRWLMAAAAGGHPEAMFSVGVRYSAGEGVKRNMEEAVKWFQRAADAGQPQAAVNLGFCYAYGDGVPKDMTRASECFSTAVKGGLEMAKEYLKEANERVAGTWQPPLVVEPAVVPPEASMLAKPKVASSKKTTAEHSAYATWREGEKASAGDVKGGGPEAVGFEEIRQTLQLATGTDEKQLGLVVQKVSLKEAAEVNAEQEACWAPGEPVKRRMSGRPHVDPVGGDDARIGGRPPDVQRRAKEKAAAGSRAMAGRTVAASGAPALAAVGALLAQEASFVMEDEYDDG